MTRWLLLCAACLAVYWLPVLAGSPDGALFFVANSSWSMLLCAAALRISRSRTALSIAILEFAAIALNFVCLWQYMTVQGWLYGAYGSVIEVIVLAEILVLALGAPWDGIRRVVRERWGHLGYNNPAYVRSQMDSREGKA